MIRIIFKLPDRRYGLKDVEHVNIAAYGRLYNVRWKEAINDLLENIQEEY